MPVPRVQILVCTNERGPETGKPSCAPRGGLEVYRRFKDAIRDRGLRDEVLATRTGCLRHCSLGITVGVWPHNHWYGGVAPEDAEEILAAAIAGRTVDRLLLPEDAPWE